MYISREFRKDSIHMMNDREKQLFEKLKRRLTKKLFFDILFSLKNNDEQKKTALKIFIRSRDN